MSKETICMIENVVALICWTIIAIIFDTWWLVFFSILFMSSVKKKHYRICDKCGKYSPLADSPDAAIIKAQNCGWIRRKNAAGTDWENFCPDCK